jgi:hypothetical protein
MHYIHLGHVGLVTNLRWGEFFDFWLGFVGIDFANDDGVEFGHWPWMPAREQPAQ